MPRSPEGRPLPRFCAVAEDLVDARRFFGLASLLGADQALQVYFEDGSRCTPANLNVPELHRAFPEPSTPVAQRFGEAFGRTTAILGEVGDECIFLSGGSGLGALAAAVAAASRDIPIVRVGAGYRTFARSRGLVGLAPFVADHMAIGCLAFSCEAASILDREGLAPPLVSLTRDPLRAFVAARVSTMTGVPDGLAIRLGRAAVPMPMVSAIVSGDDGSVGPLRVVETSGVNPLAGEWSEAQRIEVVRCETFADVLRVLASAEAVITDTIDGVFEAVASGRPAVVLGSVALPPGLAEAGWVQTATPEGATKAARELVNLTQSDPAGDRIDEPQVYFAQLDQMREGTFWHRYGPLGVLPDARPARMFGRAYRQLLRDLKDAGYRFAGFPDARDSSVRDSEEPLVLMRHDIDLELGPALRIAEVEEEEWVRSTFFFLLRTDHYNVFSAAGSEEVHAILDMGHRLGLHFDCAAYPRSYGVGAVRRAVATEVEMLESWFGRPVEAVSFHRPNELELGGDPGLTTPLPHTYMAEFTEGIQYVSDSGGAWRSGSPTELDAFRERRSLHVLVHPVWWDDPPADPFRALQRFIDRRRAALERSLARNSRPFRVGWLEVEE